MGYTHYYYREKIIEKEKFKKIVSDFRKMLPALSELNVRLANGMGKDSAEITDEIVCFNGPKKCGHEKNESISIPWPSKEAGGVAKYGENRRKDGWFAGAVIDKRCCNGDCSYETFLFQRVFESSFPQKRDEKFFSCCKTAFRPYDLAINIFLVIAEHHLSNKIKVHSDGEMMHWQEAMMLCQIHIGYGLEFKLDKD